MGDAGFKPKEEFRRGAVLANGADRRLTFQAKLTAWLRIVGFAEPRLNFLHAVQRLEFPTKSQQITPVTVGMHHRGDAGVIALFQHRSKSRQPSLGDASLLRG